MRYWSATNPNVLLETPLQPQKVTVWCGFHAGGVIGAYFFVDENARHVTVNGERYRAMLEDYLWPELDELDMNDMWFQQDGATCYLEKWSGRMAASFIRSNAIGFLFMGPYQITGLCQQVSNFSRPQRQHPTRN